MTDLKKKTTRPPSAEEETCVIKQGMNMSGSFKKVLDLSSGDSHNAGMKPITFVRQVIAGCVYPSVLQSDALPPGAHLRALMLLQCFDGGSIGSYTESCGSMYVRNTIAKSISLRDGGIPSSPERVFITVDTQRGLMVMMRLLCQSEGVSAVMIPDPTPHTLTRLLERMGVVPLPYQLQEQSGWSVERAELNRVIQAARGRCSPRAIYISNPGDPTGHVQSRESIEDVIRFAADEDLFLLVNEVYQNTVFADGSEFVSYKRVLAEMGAPYSESVQLASLHSLSNGIMGECGFRTGYMELVNVDPAVMLYTEVLLTGDLCPPVIGQIALDVMADPPLPGEASYTLYTQEVASRLMTLKCNVSRAVEFINDLPGFSCPFVQSGIFIYPLLTLPHSAVTHSQSVGLLYSRRLLEDQGVCVGFTEDHTHSQSRCHFSLWGCCTAGGCWRIRVCVSGSLKITHIHRAAATSGTSVGLLYSRRLLEDQGVCVGFTEDHTHSPSRCHFRLCVLMPSDELEEALRRLRCFHFQFLKEYCKITFIASQQSI